MTSAESIRALDPRSIAVRMCRWATHPRPDTCFESRRWVSSLAALHLLRNNQTTDIPFEIAQVWWETGEAAVKKQEPVVP